ncbi:hypothetical protein N2152v2_009958 [Parachlorella kessleri]
MSAVSIAAFRQPSSSSPVQPCPLHACLALYGITDLAAFSAPRHLALSQEEVSSNVEPKLAALAAEGLGPKQIVQLVAARSTASILSCSYKDTFMPILQLLRQIGAYTEHQAHPKSPHLTAAGKALADNPTVAAQYLCRDPGKVQELLQWLEGSLDVGMKQLAACNSLCSALCLSTGAANAICMSLQEQQVPAGQVAHMLLRQPTAFGLKPRVLSARLGTLQQHLGLDAAAALQLAMAHPRLLTNNVEARLPPLLDFLDGYMGEHGAGRRLVRAQPPLGSVTAKAAERSVGKLAVRGCSQQQIRGMINRTPTLLKLNLDSPLQRQKLEWIERVLPWTLDDFVSVPACLTYSTSRLAPRLALLRELKLQPPSTPGCLAAPSSVTFMATVRKQLAGQGREVPWASWAEWEEGAHGFEVLPPIFSSLPHNTPAADLPALLSLLSSPQVKQQEQQHVSVGPWQMLHDLSVTARQRPMNLTNFGGCRTRVTAAIAAAHASSAKPARGHAKGHSTGTGATSSDSSSSRPAQLCPLHACLLHHGITDLAAFSAPKHLALSHEAVSNNVEPKLAALAAEGLNTKQIKQLLSATVTASPLSCSYKNTFLPNLQLLRQIGAFIDHMPHPKIPHLTAAGKILADSPGAAARYLSRHPSKVQEQLQWLESSLGVGVKQLAACKDLCNALTVSAGAASAVCSMLQQEQVSAEQVAHMLLRQPTAFKPTPKVLSSWIGALQQHLGLGAAAALQVAIAYPRLLSGKLDTNLPPLLNFLDGYMGEEGAGCRLVCAQPSIAMLTGAAAERSVGSLAARGTCRLAARLALLRQFGLQPPATPSRLASPSSATFTAAIRKRLARQGRELPWASWAEWEEAWLGSEEGREWGFPPLKD